MGLSMRLSPTQTHNTTITLQKTAWQPQCSWSAQEIQVLIHSITNKQMYTVHNRKRETSWYNMSW